jgi:hypothetical protein
MKHLIKQVGALDKDAALKIVQVMQSAIMDDATLILLRSDDSTKRLKGMKSLLNTLSIDLLSKLEGEKNVAYVELVEKRVKQAKKALLELMKIIKHLQGEHRL